MKKRIAILGSTGSVGKQALEVIALHPHKLEVEVLAANENIDLLAEQAIKFNPNVVVIGKEHLFEKLTGKLQNTDIKIYAGTKALEQVTAMDTIDMVLMAILGFNALKPTLAALQNKKPVAMASKEAVAIAGNLITKKVMENHVPFIPVDSEHSAIFQCLTGEGNNTVKKVILTASGGPFIGYTAEQLENVTPQEALKHPNWKMGDKISIDSATLMNKGLEIIEAHWLFGLSSQQIEVLIHPQSTVHAMVYFTDGNIKSVMSVPDMKIPIMYAFSYPERYENGFPDLDLLKLNSLTFEAPDTKNFRNLALAFKALEKGGNAPCVLSAANEVAVYAFLKKEIKFTAIPEVIEKCLESFEFISDPTLEDYEHTDKATRKAALSIIEKMKK